MRLKFLLGAAMMAALGVAMLPSSALSVAQIHEGVDEAADYDSRVGKIAPTTAQRAHAKRLKASVSWSKFGTPASLSRRGKFLARGVRGKTAADAARWYLNRHKRLFGLGSVDQLELLRANRLTGSNGWSVNFRQVFGQLQAAEGGLVTVGVTGTARRGWKIGHVSSALTRDRSLTGSVKFSSAGAWVTAAKSVGLTRSVANVLSRKAARGWTNLAVSGLETQRARLVAFPTVRNGVVPAYETLVLDTKSAKPLAHRVYVDARSNRVLARTNLVDHASSGIKLLGPTHTFNGEVSAADGACGPDHSFVIPAGNRALDGFAAATVITNDLVLFLIRDGTVLVEADTLFSPEQFRYEPAGGVPAGTYVVRVCDFDEPGTGPGWVAPRTYTGTLTEDDSPAPPPYLARWQTFPGNPPLHLLPAFPWNNPSTDNRETWCWVAAPGCDRVVNNLASRGPWDHDHKLNTATFTTRGNNAKAATSWTDPFLPSPPQFMPTSATRDYSFPWTNDWFKRSCEPTAGTPGSTWDDSAATVNLFVAHNRMHDWSYFLGFTEMNWNAQDYNFGLTEKFRENDPIIGNVQAGALIPGVRDNANMITLPDGLASVTNMYFWQPFAGSFYAPCVDGDYDMPIIGHEYGHMIENRMIGKGVGRSGHHAGAMGESFGDMNAMEYVNANGFLPTSDENPFTVGAYATGNKQHAIRNYSMGFPSFGGVPTPSQQLSINALNFSDMGYDVTGPQVHADGEIWSASNFRIRTLLQDKYDDDFPSDDADLQESCAEGITPAQNCPGNRRWFQLYYDAMLLMPVAPSMLDARNAILSADLMRFGGANQKELWLGFARSGYGDGATSSNTTADTDIDPTPSFASPLENNATVTFVARERGGAAIANARLYVGHYEARVSPIADTNPATSGTNLDDTADFAPGTYEFVTHAPGYGHVRFRERLRSGQNNVITVEFTRNLASAASGATVAGDGTGLGNLIDDTENTNWNAPGTVTAGNLTVDGKQATVDLAGTDEVTVRFVQVSAHIGAGNSRFSALRQFQLQACNADEGDNCSTAAGFTPVYTSPANAFPGDPPRPVAPQLILRKFDVPNFEATHIRFVVKTNQCTGTPAYQGEQDADPNFTTDCDTNVAPTSTRALARTAEFQAFDRDPDVD